MNYNPLYAPYKNVSPEEYYTKRSIKKASNCIGGALIMMNVLPTIIMVLFSFLLVGLFGQQTAYDVASSSIYTWIMQIALSAIMFLVPFAVAAVIMKFRVSDLLPLKKVRPSLCIPLVMMAMGIMYLGNYATSYLSQIINLFGVQPAQAELPSLDGGFGTTIMVITIAFLPPLVEEFALRGVVLGSLRRFGDGFAIFVSACLFGLMHGNLVQAPFAFVGGLALGYITVASGSLWPAIITHFINNLLSTVMSECGSLMTPRVYEFVNIISVVAILILGLIGMALFLKEKPDGLRLAKPKGTLSGKKKLAAFASTPLMSLALVMFGLTIIFVQIIN